MKIEIDINDIVTLKIALNHAERRINELINDKPEWRRLYDLDKETIVEGQKILANAIAND